MPGWPPWMPDWRLQVGVHDVALGVVCWCDLEEAETATAAVQIRPLVLTSALMSG
jgi:hypothetical protein